MQLPAIAEIRKFRELLEADPDVAALDPGVLDETFDLQRSLRNVHAVFDALDELVI